MLTYKPLQLSFNQQVLEQNRKFYASETRFFSHVQLIARNYEQSNDNKEQSNNEI